jgi:hypothetical protein
MTGILVETKPLEFYYESNADNFLLWPREQTWSRVILHKWQQSLQSGALSALLAEKLSKFVMISTNRLPLSSWPNGQFLDIFGPDLVSIHLFQHIDEPF